MAERTGLEPAAFRVTGGRYNQLNYLSVAKTNVNDKIKAEPLEIQQLIHFKPHLLIFNAAKQLTSVVYTASILQKGSQ